MRKTCLPTLLAALLLSRCLTAQESPPRSFHLAANLLGDAASLPPASDPFQGASLDPDTPGPVGPATDSVPKHFFTGAGEVVLLEAIPWAFDRYVSDEDFARISLHTVNRNLKAGFHYDRDHFNINQSSHPYHGSLFFEAGRSNGYGYWESGLFALTGSLLWECCMENDRPSINDLVNTTLGGMTRGEISHRIAIMILDNEATGTNRFLRELGAAVVNPVGALSRLVHGDMGREYPNPEERFPGSFSVAMDLGYRRIGGGARQTFLSLAALYGDPFAGDIHKPFDSFWVGIDLNAPHGAAASRIEERGILKGWDLSDPESKSRHVLGVSQEYEYLNNKAQVFGAQIFSGGLLSRYDVGSKLKVVTDFNVLAVPLAGIQTRNFENPETGRNYDYAPGGGARAAVRVFGWGREAAAAEYGIVWAHTVNGLSDNNRLEFFRATARVPITGPVGLGGGYWWYSRRTKYPGGFEDHRTQSEWRAFINIAFGAAQRKHGEGAE